MSKSMVFIGGWSRDRSSYDKLIKHKPDNIDFHFISPREIDLNDIGLSIDIFLNKSQIEKVELVGHSVGGAVAMEYATDLPDKVKRLILIDSEGVPGSEKFQKFFVNFAKNQLTNGHRKINENAKSVLKLFNSPATGLKFAKHAHYSDLRDKLSKISVPTLILWGENDSLTPLWQGELMNRDIAGSKLLVFKNMDHDWPIHRPDLFWENYNNVR